jgi:signal transduction histidine kinase
MALNLPRLPQQRVSLRLILLVPFILQTTAAVGLTGYLSWRSGQNSLHDLIVRLQKSSSQQVKQQLDSYLSTPKQLAKTTADAFASGRLTEDDLDNLGRHFHSQVKHYNIGYASYGSLKGFYIAAGHMSDSTNGRISRDVLIPKYLGDRKNHIYSTDDQGNFTSLDLVEDYHFQLEPWFADITTASNPTQGWTKITPWEATPYPLSIGAAIAIRDRNQKLIGSVAVDQRLTQISEVLKKFNPSPGSETFILERDGNLVASSSPQPPYKQTDKGVDRLQATESSNLLVGASSQFLLQNFRSFHSIKGDETLSFLHHNKRHFISTNLWQDEWGLDWIVVVAIPEADFTQKIQENTHHTIILSILALLGSVLLSLYTSQWILRPIVHLKNAALDLATENLDYKIAPSSIDEIDQLGQSFNQMAQQLQTSLQALEASNNDLEQRVADRTQALTATLTTLQNTQTQLVQTEKMSGLGQMVGGVMHEINNPTTFIYGNLTHCKQYLQTLTDLLQLYQSHYPEPPRALAQAIAAEDISFILGDWPSLIASMEQGASRIKAIVSSLQDFAHINESGLKSSNLNNGLDNTLLILVHSLLSNNIQVIKHYDNLPDIKCYPSLLNQVFYSLINNAIEAQATTIQLTTTSQPDQITLTIADNGNGIPSDIQAKIFDPFFTTKPVGKGTGLGLAIAYQIITQQHQGQISVASQIHQGTTFTLTIRDQSF